MAILIGIVLALLCIGVVMYPFFKTRSLRRVVSSAPIVTGEVTDVDSIYEAIQTLQLEYQVGKVPEEVYREQFHAYRLQAAVALRDQEQARSAEQVVEAEISAIRIATYGIDGVAIPCPGCNSAVDAATGRCPECGATLDTPEASPAGPANE